MLNIVCIPEQCVFQCTCNTSVHTNTSMLCNRCFISCYCLLLVQVTLPQEMGPRWNHTATVFGSGPNFRMVVMFGGRRTWVGDLIAETILLHLGECACSLEHNMIHKQEHSLW